MTNQTKTRVRVVLALCACLAAGQAVMAAGDGVQEDSSTPVTLYVSGSAAALDNYLDQVKAQAPMTMTVPLGEATREDVKIPVVQAPLEQIQVPVVGAAAVYDEGNQEPETVPEVQIESPEISSEEENGAMNTETEEAGTEESEAGENAPEEVIFSEADYEPLELSQEEQAIADAEAAAKLAAEQDWEARGAAIAGYDNFGIAYVDSYLNIRRNPSSDSVVVGKLLRDSGCEILDTVEKEDGIWYEIRSGSVTGYVSSDYMLTGQDARDRGRDMATMKAVIQTETLNVRSEADTESAIWTQVSSNERYEVLDQMDGWVEIEIDDETGFVNSDYVEVRYALRYAIAYSEEQIEAQERQSLRWQIVDYACQFVGNPYVWGGESLTNGIDCSGFTMKVYQHFGYYNLSHYSVSQAGEGRQISEDELKPGDLIFYAKNGTINHVAIYMGNGQAVHAKSKSAGITITDYNYRTPVRFVRILDD